MVGRGTRLRVSALAVLLAVAAGAIYLNAMDAPFVLDDIAAVTENRGASWPLEFEGIFGKNYWGNREGYENLTIYRPLATLTFALTDCIANGEDPSTHRVVNVALHSLCTVLVFLLALSLLKSHRSPLTAPAAFSAALLFALHPVHTEAVIGIVNRAELLAALFVLLGSLIYLSGVRGSRALGWRHRGLLWAVFVLALLSKENGFTLVGVVVAVDLVRVAGHRRETGSWRNFAWDWRTYAGLAVVFGGYMVLRGAVLSGLLAGDLSGADNPMVDAGFMGRWLTPFKVFFWYLRLLVAPVYLTVDYSLNHLPAVDSLLDFEAWAGLLLFVGALASVVTCAWQSGRDVHARVVAISLLAFFATYSVVSNLAFLSTIIMAERLVYLPSAFFLIAVAAAAWNAMSNYGGKVLRIAGIGTLALVCGLYGWRTLARNGDWESARSLYVAAVEVAPNSAKTRHLLARELYRAGRYDEANAHFAAAVAIDSSNFVARTNYARTLAKSGDFDGALGELRTALTHSPGYRPALNLVCAIFERTGRPSGARKFCFPPGRKAR